MIGERTEPDAPASAAIAAAEAGVARAGVAFTASLHDASLAGRETAERVVSVVRPLLIGAGVVAGVVVAVRILRGPSRARGPTLRAESAEPIWSELARSGAIALASVIARGLAERWLDTNGKRLVGRLSAALAGLVVLLALPH